MPNTHVTAPATTTRTDTVTVVIPSYNDATFLPEAVDSVLRQEFHGTLKVLIIDDGSNPPTDTVYIPTSDKVSIVRRLHGGVASARNHGIQITQSRYIAFLDADDIMLPGRLASHIEILDSRQDVGLVAGDITRRNVDGTEETWGIFETYKDKIPSDNYNEEICIFTEEFSRRVLLEYPFNTSVMTVRRAVLQQTGIRFHAGQLCWEDWDLVARIAQVARIAYCRKPVTIYRRRPGSITTTANPAKFESRAEMFMRWLEDFENLGFRTRRALRKAWVESMITASWDYRQAGSPFARACAWKALRRYPGLRALKNFVRVCLPGGRK
jgi:glycosyltransferase involved in cell wall biosynthesis